MLSTKYSPLLKIKKPEKYQIGVMDPVSHPGITLILFGRSAIQPACLFDIYLFVRLKSPLLKKWSFSSLPLIYSRRVVVSYKRKYVHKLLVNRLFKPAQEKVWLGELTVPQMTIAVDLGRKATKTNT